MNDPITRDGEMTTAEANKLERLMRAMRTNEGIKINGGIGTLIAVISLAINIGTVVYFSGKLVNRIEVLERNHTDTSQRMQASDAVSVQHTVQIEVTKSKLSDIQAGIDRIEKTMSNKR